MPELLDTAAVDDWLAARPQWRRDGDAIVRSVQAPSFLDGIDLVQRVARVAEERDHHPDIDIRWRTVTLRLSTHSAGGLTALDLALADEIDRLA
jgi:4a-hydroxytetrahydrobiopterin dehydratase